MFDFAAAFFKIAQIYGHLEKLQAPGRTGLMHLQYTSNVILLLLLLRKSTTCSMN